MYYIFFGVKQKENKELSKDIFRLFQDKLSCHVPSVARMVPGIDQKGMHKESSNQNTH